MSGVLLDTNILIDYLRGLPAAASYLENSSDTLSISALSLAELRAGARNDEEKEGIRTFVLSFDVLPVDAVICETGGDFRARYGPSHGVDLIDGIIAATSQVRQLPLVTLNKKHFPMLDNVIVPYRRRN
jgi:predicted nucleic acid-binding protein